MDYSTFFLVLSFFLTFIYALILSGHRNSRLPPNPYPLPIIGNLLELRDKSHRSLATLAKRYGPLMSIKLGSRTTIVVSSPEVAKEFFLTHDRSFSSRSIPDGAQGADHHKFSIVWLPVEEQWRRLRKIIKENLFSVQCLDASELLRTKKVYELIGHVDSCCKHEKAVNVGAAMFTTMLNIFSNLVFSTDFVQYDSSLSQEFKETVEALAEVSGKPNLVDCFPILKPIDPQGIARWINVCGKKLLTVFDGIIDQRLERRLNSLCYDDFSSVDVLDSLLNLNLKNEHEIGRDNIRHLLSDIFTAGTDTTSSTLEWAMSELIRNPDKMETARSELNKHMQNEDRNIHEKDIPQLPYLQAVIKETLRIHPPVPFLIPHQAIHDVEVLGFIVPKNAQILCNVWAMGRDANIWSDPETFKPERFLDVKIDYKGQDFELISFGAGRRICPGLNLAHRMMHVVLGSLIQKFDWKLDGNMRPQDMDMREKPWVTLRRDVPLMAIPVKF